MTRKITGTGKRKRKFVSEKEGWPGGILLTFVLLTLLTDLYIFTLMYISCVKKTCLLPRLEIK